MRLNFSLRTLLLAVTFAAVALGGVLALLNNGAAADVEWSFTVQMIIVVSPAWVPVAFVGYAIGRRQLTARTVLVFALAEITSIGVMLWADLPPTHPWSWPW